MAKCGAIGCDKDLKIKLYHKKQPTKFADTGWYAGVKCLCGYKYRLSPLYHDRDDASKQVIAHGD